LPHTHIALDDALEQGALFCNMLAELRAREAALVAALVAVTSPDSATSKDSADSDSSLPDASR
ncbi:hypothetical protein SB860_41445, partial [Burkholderia sp. SIMBA_019]